jgi:hypothetical protein
MELIKALSFIRAELERAERKFPKFPTDPVHAAAVVVEEAGKLQKAALELTYEDGGWAQVFEEAIHTGAMALRFLIHLDQMKERPSEQVERVANGLQQPLPAGAEAATSEADVG